MAEIRLELDRREAPAGGRLAGIVILMVDAPSTVRGLRVRLRGCEKTTAGGHVHEIVSREVVLTGREPFRSRLEALADTWRHMLGRSRYPVFQPGEYAYPFAIDLPDDLPPTARNAQHEVRYFLTAYADTPGWARRTARPASEEIIAHPATDP